MSKTYKIPKNYRIYAIGDIHGQLDQLKKLHNKIDEDIEVQEKIDNVQIVYLGDYIDRGMESKETIQHILERELTAPKVEPVYLMGNHESGMLGFMKDPHGPRRDWLEWGGIETLHSYGVKMTGSFDDLASDLDKALPNSHHEFLKNLRSYYELVDYVFVHAGIRAGN